MISRALAILGVFGLLGASSLFEAGARADGLHRAEIEGACTYSDQLAPLVEQQHVFAQCDRMIVLRDGDRVELTFSYPSRLRSIAFAGVRDAAGDTEISSVRLRSWRQWDKAEGHCKRQPAAEGQSTVTCLVKSGAFFYAANFTSDG